MTWIIFFRESFLALAGLCLRDPIRLSAWVILFYFWAVQGLRFFIENQYYNFHNQVKKVRWVWQPSENNENVHISSRCRNMNEKEFYLKMIIIQRYMDDKKEKEQMIELTTKNISKQKSNRSQSDRQTKTIDIQKLLSKKQRSRQSKVYFQTKKYNQKRQSLYRHSDYPSNFRNQNISVNQDEQKYSTYANKPPAIIKNIDALDESFLSGNESNSIIGILLYLLFVIFISIEVIMMTYIIPKKFSKNQFYLQTALFTILLSQLLYYIVLRYLSHHTKKRLFLHNSARKSFDKLMKLSKTIKKQNQQKEYSIWLIQRPYLLLASIIVTVVICQILYSKLATEISFIFQESDKQYMVSTLFWSNFALPYLFNNFYLMRPVQDKNLKVKIFSFVIIAYMAQTLIQGFLFFSLMAFNMFQTYIQSKKQFDTFHVNQLIKIFMLIGVSVYMIIKYSFGDGNTLFNGYVLKFILTLLAHVIFLTISMLITRIIAIKYIKQQLYRYYYTQTSINMAFIFVTFALNLTYLNQYHRNQSDVFTSVIINLIFLTILGFVIYAEGRQRLLVTMDQKNQEDY